MTDAAKRETLTLLGGGAIGTMISGLAGAENMTTTPEIRSSYVGGREPKPLPFDPTKLNGLRSTWMLSCAM